MLLKHSLINLACIWIICKWWKKINPNLISRIQDRRGKTIFKKEIEVCLGCDKFIDEEFKYPEITNSYKRIFSEETAYQMTNILRAQ